MISGTKQRMSAWVPVVVYCVLLFIQSSFPSPSQLSPFPGADKFQHFGAYALLGMLCMRAFRVSPIRVSLHTILFYSIFLTVLYGISDEIHQLFVAARHADVIDVLADGVGGVSGVYLYFLIYRGSFVGSGKSR